MPFNVKGDLSITKGISQLGSDTNMRIGRSALQSITGVGSLNIAIGDFAMQNATVASDNIAIGFSALSLNGAGANNLAIGAQSLQSTTTGSANIALGTQSLQGTTSGSFNVSVGINAGILITTGSNNTSVGVSAGGSIVTGSFNTCVGLGTAANVGGGAATGCIAIGISSANVPAVATTNNGLFFHNAVATAAGAAVQYNAATGQMGPVASSVRFKENVTEMDVDSSLIFQLKPVSYNLISETARPTKREFGFLAEDVISVLPEVAPTDAEGQPMSVNYDRLVVLVIEELRKLRAEVTEIHRAVFAS
jgi:Marseilleviridae peptidase